MADLPTGTVTFFFSDVEGSTGLLQRLGPGSRAVLGEHADIVRSVVAGADGVEVKTMGDGFFVVFRSAGEGVEAAAEVQRRHHRHSWPEGGTVRVRVGLHTGEGRLGANDYEGIDVHRAARIGEAGHGGQVVVSETTRALAAASLGYELRFLGRHLLRGLDQPESLYQVMIPGLPESFPPLRAAETRPHNLPVVSTSLLGRAADLSRLLASMGEARLVTLVGPGGGGKTRLAIAAASEALPSSPTGWSSRTCRR